MAGGKQDMNAGGSAGSRDKTKTTYTKGKATENTNVDLVSANFRVKDVQKWTAPSRTTARAQYGRPSGLQSLGSPTNGSRMKYKKM